MSIAPTRWMSYIIVAAGTVTLFGALATILHHAEEIGLAAAAIALAMLGLMRWSR
ncbi:hypothetical protein [Halolamina rubra]|uniref:hypothetical protein n=1 Tax=Halolamina rubra TaxID=1380430 RepID=UPI0012AC30C6|nr:hypothetical protein [Halolamina rubra]